MTKERSAALTTVLVLLALGWGLVRRSHTAGKESLPGSTVRPESDRAGRVTNADAARIDLNDTGDVVVKATPFRFASERTPRRKPPRKTPAELKPKNALPLFPPASNNDELRTIIRKALPNASELEINVWRQKLHGMDFNAARTVLEMRKRFPLNARAKKIAPPLPNLKLPPPRHVRKKTHVPRTADSQIPVQVRNSIDALIIARNFILNNIANAHTPGFKRNRVIFTNRPPATIKTGESKTVAVGTGIRIAAVQRDWSPGRLIKTGRELDIAIEGYGFFVLKDGEKTVYTRCGRFELNTKNQLAYCGDRNFVAKPTAKVLIKPTGSHPNAPCVPMPLVVHFRSRDSLKSIGNGLYVTTETPRSWLDKQHAIVFPRLYRTLPVEHMDVAKSGYVEASNVNIQREVHELKKIAEHMRSLKQAVALFDNLDRQSPARGPVANKPAFKTTGFQQPKNKIELQFGFDLKRFLQGDKGGGLFGGVKVYKASQSK